MLDYKPQAQKTAVDKALQSFAQTRLGGKLFISVFPAIDRRLLPLTRGRLSTGLGQPVVLLHVRGAKSGAERTVPLLATKQDDLVVLIASKAGAVKHPAWFHNVKANPDVEVTLRGRARADARHDRRRRGARAPVGDGGRQLLRLRPLPDARGRAHDPGRGAAAALTQAASGSAGLATGFGLENSSTPSSIAPWRSVRMSRA